MSHVSGTFTIPIYDGQPAEFPSTRPYLAPPKPKETIEKTFPLVDFRGQVSHAGELDGPASLSVAQLLSKQGFTAVHWPTKLSDFQDGQKIKDIYLPEMKAMLKTVTGCREVFMNASVLRGPAPEMKYDGVVPLGLSKEQADALAGKSEFPKPMSARPIRMPHNDYTPLGGRQTIRAVNEEVRDYGRKCGVIAAEDALCSRKSFTCVEKESDGIFEAKYNDHAAGRLGPRYATYSLWRPLKAVTRDPLALVSYRDLRKFGGEQFVIWPYQNRARGIDGDWHREFEMLKIQPEAVDKEVPPGLRFSYLSDMQPDEVLIVKLFDSAGLGEGAKESIGTMHGSPDLGENAHGGERESLEIRVIAFW